MQHSKRPQTNTLVVDIVKSDFSQQVKDKLNKQFSLVDVDEFDQLHSGNTVLLLIASQYHLADIDAWQKACLKHNITLVPLRLANSKWQLGPVAQEAGDACIGCAKTWEKNNHPSKETYDAIHALGSNIDFPYSMLALNHIVLVLAQWINMASQAKNLQFVYCANTESNVATHHQIINYSNCETCEPIVDDNAHDATLTLQPVYKTSTRNYRRHNPLISEENLRKHYLDFRYGLIKHVFKSDDTHIIPLVCAEMPFVDGLGQENSYGRTDDISTSSAVAILESLERYAGHAPRARKTCVRGSYKELQEHAIDPESFILHDDDDGRSHLRRFFPYDDSLEFNWVWGHSFKHQQARLMPEQLVYYRIETHSKEPVNRFVYESSNGCALGGSLEEATFYGLMEVIERDAYLTTWYGKISPTLLDMSQLDNPQIQLVLSQAKSSGYDIYLFDITLEAGVPTIWAMAVNPAKNPKVKSYCAAGAHPDPEKAVMGALVEVVTSINVYERSLPEYREKAEAMLKDVNLTNTMPDHVLLYSLEETYDWLSFLFDSGKTVEFTERFQQWYTTEPSLNLTAELEHILDRVLDTFEDVIVIDQTYSALKHADVNAVKVFVLGAHTITFGHQHQRVSLDRVNAARQFRGLAPLSKAELNTHVPHNFP